MLFLDKLFSKKVEENEPLNDLLLDMYYEDAEARLGITPWKFIF